MRVSQFIVFFLVLAVVLGLASFYVGRRVKQAFGLGPKSERVLVVTMFGAIVSMIVARAAALRVVGEVAFTMLLAVLISTFFLLVIDLVKLGLRPALRLGEKRKPAVEENPVLATESLSISESTKATEAGPTPKETASEPAAQPNVEPKKEPDPSKATRRVFLGQAATGSALLVGSGSSLYGALFGRHDYTIEEVPVRIKGLSKKLDGYTIVQISDIHFGIFVGDAERRAAEELIRKARADRIVMTGDLLDNDARFAPSLGELVRNVSPMARDGVVVIPGNHDWYAGVQETMGAAEAAGAKVLRNDGLVIGDAKDGIALLGVDDVWARRMQRGMGPDLDLAISRVPADLPRVLLCHNPVFFPEAAGKIALQLSGHTHGGQVNLGVLQPGKLVLPHGYIAGMYEREGAKLWVNRGFGTAGPPARVGAPPEITRIVLVAA